MVIGSIGMIMLGLGFVRYFTLVYDIQGYFLSIVGYALVNNYIYSIEKKAGISKKLIWIKSILCMLTLAIASYIFYV